jgi:hypothetical protein
LQLAIMLVVAVAAGVACLGILTRMRFAALVHRSGDGVTFPGRDPR